MCHSFCGLLLFLILINISSSANVENTYLKGSLFGGLYSMKLNSSKNAHNETVSKDSQKEIKQYYVPDAESMAGTEAAVLIIVVIVVLSVIGMVVYFVRKFDQLNRSLPTYRYSSLKTEINGIYGPDDKIESQVLVSVSTEEEDDFDDEEDNLSPPTLLVKSQTVMTNKSSNGTVPVHHDNNLSSQLLPKNEETAVDSDEELLQ